MNQSLSVFKIAESQAQDRILRTANNAIRETFCRDCLLKCNTLCPDIAGHSQALAGMLWEIQAKLN